MQRTKLICNNFSGISRTASGFTSSQITATDMQNVELFFTEANAGIGIRTVKGNISICDLIPDDEVVINIFESVQKNDTYFFVHTENKNEGKIYLFSPIANTLTLKVSGLSVTEKSCGCDFAQGWSDLWIFSNSEEMLSIELGNYNSDNELDEVTMMDLKDSEGRTVKGLGLKVFAGRLWVFNEQVLWYSMQENIYDFSTSSAELLTSAGFIEFVKSITAIYPYLGTLAVFHKNSSCLIALEDDGYGFTKTIESVGGCASSEALVFHGTELYFYDNTKKGIFCFRQIVNGDTTLGENIALDVQEELFEISSNDLHRIKTLSVVTSEKNEVWFLLPSDDEKYSQILIYDYIRKCWIKRKSQKINCIAVIGDILYSAGKKIYEEYISNNFDGEFIESFYKCAPINLGTENKKKVFSTPPKISLDMNYNNKFYVKYTKNYDFMSTRIHAIQTKSVQDFLYFDIGHWDFANFAVKEINSIKKLPISNFNSLQITFLTSQEGEDFCIRNIEFGKIKLKKF